MGAQKHPPTEHRTHETFSVSVPDLEYWREQIKCQYACPVGTDARGYVRAIARGDFDQAYLIARGPNPLASICGRVCGAPCEEECRRAELDQPIAIRALKRYVCEKFGPGSHHRPRDLARFLKEIAQKHADPRLEGREELLPLLQSLLNADVPPADGQSVGVVGSGPAGLAAAHDLALLGFDVTIYEAEPILGGMLVLGIPEYRLPRDLIRSEIQVIEQLGVKSVTSCEVGKHVSLPELRETHEAVVIAVGAKRSRSLDVPGSDAEGVLGGVEFLRDVALGNPPSLGKRVVVIAEGDESPPTAGEPVVVIGGGNTAIDAARTALRLGGGPVTILYRRTREEMPAIREEIEEAIREGVEVRFLVAPAVLEGDRRVRAVRCAEMELGEPDESGRRRPIPKPDSEVVVEAEHVIVAIGQEVDLGFVDHERDGLELTDSGFITCDPDTGRTPT